MSEKEEMTSEIPSKRMGIIAKVGTVLAIAVPVLTLILGKSKSGDIIADILGPILIILIVILIVFALIMFFISSLNVYPDQKVGAAKKYGFRFLFPVIIVVASAFLLKFLYFAGVIRVNDPAAAMFLSFTDILYLLSIPSMCVFGILLADLINVKIMKRS